MAPRATLQAAIAPVFPIRPFAVDGAGGNLALHFLIFWAFDLEASIHSFHVAVAPVDFDTRPASSGATTPITPFGPDAINGATLDIAWFHPLKAPRTAHASKLSPY